MKFLITANYPEWARQKLSSLGPVHYDPWIARGRILSENELLSRIQETSSDVLITEVDQVTAHVLNNASLRAVGVCRGTPVNVDINAATSRGIAVFRTPGRNAQAVAELSLALMLMALRHLTDVVQWVRGGHWTREEMSLAQYRAMTGRELTGKTVGLMGLGAVGQSLARLLLAFPAKVLYYDPYVQLPHDLAGRIEARVPEDLFSDSDIVSVHLPITEKTRQLIGIDLLGRMPGHAVFINTSRAGVVDREALISALEGRKIAAAALDVFDQEPLDDPMDRRLAMLPNVIPTPHIGGATLEVADHQAHILNAAIMAWMRGEERAMPELVNPSVLENGRGGSP